MRRVLSFLLIGIIGIIVLVACNENDAKLVSKIPSGFISLSVASSEMNDVLSYVFWESQISFLDSDNVCIYQTNVKNDKFIIKHENQYYVDEIKYLELVNFARNIFEQRNNLYNLGDEVELRGVGDVIYTIEIVGVLKVTSDEKEVYEVKFNIDTSVSEQEIMGFFDYIETNNGVIITEFSIVDDETICIKLPVGEEINTIVLKSPDYSNSIRKVNCIRE